MHNDKNDLQLLTGLEIKTKIIFQFKLRITDNHDHKKINNPNCAKYPPYQTQIPTFARYTRYI